MRKQASPFMAEWPVWILPIIPFNGLFFFSDSLVSVSAAALLKQEAALPPPCTRGSGRGRELPPWEGSVPPEPGCLL